MKRKKKNQACLILLLLLLSIGGRAEVSFVIGANPSGFKHNDHAWDGNENLSGYLSPETDGAQVALTSAHDVWGPSGDAYYPLTIDMTDHQVISGPNISIYNGYVIKSVTIELKNEYDNVLDDGQHDNYFMVSIGGMNNVVRVNESSTASTTFTVSTLGHASPFSNLIKLPVVLERALSVYFDRSVVGNKEAIRNIRLLARITVTVERVPQKVLYRMYRRLDDGTERPLLMADFFLHPSNYNNNENNAHFEATVDQYIGETPSLAPSLIRKGCIYGYDCAYIGINDDSYQTVNGESVYLVKTYYAVDNTQMPFQYSFVDFDPSLYNNVDDIQEAIKEHNPEYRYNLTSKETFIRTSGEHAGEEATLYERKVKLNTSWITYDKPLARSISFIGDPYNTLVYSPDVDGEANLRPYYLPNGGSSSSNRYVYWGVLRTKELSTDTDAETNRYFVLRDNLPTNMMYVDYYYLGKSTSGGTTRDRVYSHEGSTNIMNPADYHIDPADGAFYYSSTRTTKYSQKSFMLCTEMRPENITLNFHQSLVEGSSRTDNTPIYNLDTGVALEGNVYTHNAYCVGDTVVFSSKHLMPYYEYEYYSDPDFAPAHKANTVQSTWASPKEIYVKMTWNGPFTFSSADDSDEHWYYLKLNGKLVSATGSSPYKLERPDTAVISPMHLWKFVRNDDYTVTIKNRWFGNGYSLMRVNKDYGRSITAYNGYTGPVMLPDTQAGQTLSSDATMRISDKWEVVRNADDVFGLQGMTYEDRVPTSMNICDYRSTDMMRYFRNPAQLQSSARIEVIPLGSAPVSAGRLADYVSRCTAQAGNPFGFKTSGITGSTDEEKLTNPDNYVRDFSGYYRIRLGHGLNNFAQVRANITSSQEVQNKNVITQGKARARVTFTSSAPTADDATSIFCFNPLTGASAPLWNGHVSGESYTLNTSIAAPFADVRSNYFDNCTATIYPAGRGEAIIMADSWDGVTVSGEQLYGNGSNLIFTYKAPTTSGMGLLLESVDKMFTPFLIERVSNYGVRMTQIGGSGPAYGSLYVPFDLVVPEGITPYVATSINEDDGTVSITPATLNEGRVLPASTPVALISDDDMATATVTFAISGTAPSATTEGANSAGNKFGGTYSVFTVPKQNESVPSTDLNYFTLEEHDIYRLFGKGGSANKAGFYAYTLNAHHNVPANRAMLDEKGSSASATRVASAIFMMVVDTDDTGTITDVKAIVTEDGRDTAPEFYDLQGRRVYHPSHGTFIVKSPLLPGKGRKVLIK